MEGVSGAHNIQHASFGAHTKQVIGKEGALNGQQVMQKLDHQSLVQDSLEELPANMSDKAKDKDLKSRKKEDGSRVRELLMKMVEQMQKAGKMDPKMQNQMKGFFARLGNLKQMNAQNILEQVKQQFSSPGEQYDALHVVGEILAETLGPDHPDTKAVQNAALDLMEDKGNEVREANKFSDTMKEIKTQNLMGRQEDFNVINDLYEAKVLGRDTSKEVFQAIKTMGLKDFQAVTDKFMKSIDRVHLQLGRYSEPGYTASLVNDFCKVAFINNNLKEMQGLVNRVVEGYPGQADGVLSLDQIAGKTDAPKRI